MKSVTLVFMFMLSTAFADLGNLIDVDLVNFTPLPTHNYILQKETIDGDTIELQGTVTQVMGREFVLNTVIKRITIDAQLLEQNPMEPNSDDALEVGDRVRVLGEVSRDFYTGKEIMATSIIKI